MTTNQKVVAWVSIVGAGLIGSLATSLTFFKEQTVLITSISTLVSAVIALLVTIFSKPTTETK